MDNNGDVNVPGFDPISGKLRDRNKAAPVAKKPAKINFMDREDLFDKSNKRKDESTHSPTTLSKTLQKFSNNNSKSTSVSHSPKNKAEKKKTKKFTKVLTKSVNVW